MTRPRPKPEAGVKTDAASAQSPKASPTNDASKAPGDDHASDKPSSALVVPDEDQALKGMAGTELGTGASAGESQKPRVQNPSIKPWSLVLQRE
jgi:hypothetical protein